MEPETLPTPGSLQKPQTRDRGPFQHALPEARGPRPSLLPGSWLLQARLCEARLCSGSH